MTTAMSAQPVFARVSSEERNSFNRFMLQTNPSHIQGYGKGWSLDKLAKLAEKAYAVIQKTNPILQEGSPQSAVIPGRQWELNHLSVIKERLAKAIEYKRAYYDNSIWGMITKFVLKLFGLWNAGETTAFAKAEDFLIMYDSRFPLMRSSGENYTPRCFFPFTDAAWVRTNLDTSRFYNYNPRRSICIGQNFRYDTLDPRNPIVFIRG